MSDQRLRVLTEASRSFAEATADYPRLLDEIARRLGETVKDGCVVRLLGDDGWLSAAAIHLPIEERVGDPSLRAQVIAHVSAPHHVSEQGAAGRVLEHGEAVLVPRIDPAQLAAGATPAIVRVYEAIGIHSLLLVGLRVRGASIGLLSMVRFATPGEFTALDLALAQALADQAALAISNARLFDAVRATEAQLRYTLDSIGDGVIATDASGRIERMNPAAETLTGWPRDDAIGRPLDEVFAIHAEDSGAPAENPVTRILRDGLVVGLANHTALTARDGTVRPIADSGAPIRDQRGAVHGVVMVFRDMSDERAAEEARLRAVELAAENRRVHDANRMKSEFLARMSHELRTPLNAILGFSELLHRGEVGAVSPQQHEFLGHVVTSGRHLLGLVNDVLDLAKVEAGKLELRPERVEPRQLLDEVTALLGADAARRGVSLGVRVDPALTEVVTDPVRARQILYNYLANAIRFTPAGGSVEARIVADGDDRFRIEVADTGIGIAADDLPRLFVEFEQLGPGSGGTGLGLALTRRLVEAQGGTVGVVSTLGEGSVFHASLRRG